MLLGFIRMMQMYSLISVRVLIQEVDHDKPVNADDLQGIVFQFSGYMMILPQNFVLSAITLTG